MKHTPRHRLTALPALPALIVGWLCSGASLAYEPEIGTVIPAFPILQAGGHPFDWTPNAGSYRILVVGATWCPPCQELKSALPAELARLRQLGIAVSTVFVEADEFGPGSRVAASRGPNRWGYVDAVPDPARINLATESPKGVRDWGAFRAYGYPTTVLLDDRNVVIARYRGGNDSHGVFGDLVARVQKTGGPAPRAAASTTALPAHHLDAHAAARSAARGATDDSVDKAGDELIGLWKVDNPEARDPRPIFFRVIGVRAGDAGPLLLEASLSYKLTQWYPVAARCERSSAGCVIRLTTVNGGEFTAKRRPDGTYAGEIVFGKKRALVRPITMAPMSLNEAEL